MTPIRNRIDSDTASHQRDQSQGHDAGEIDAKRTKKLADVQRYAPRYLATFQRAFAGNSLRAAINAFCIECVGFVAADVVTCTAPDCPLFSCRPGRHLGEEAPEPEGLGKESTSSEDLSL